MAVKLNHHEDRLKVLSDATCIEIIFNKAPKWSAAVTECGLSRSMIQCLVLLTTGYNVDSVILHYGKKVWHSGENYKAEILNLAKETEAGNSPRYISLRQNMETVRGAYDTSNYRQ